MSPLPRRDTQTQVRSLKSELEDLLSAVALEGSSEGLPESFAGSVTDEGIFGSEGLEADRDLLARSALRAALDEEADSHARSRTRLDEREYDLEEAEARFGVDLATERAENLRLQTLVRKLGRAGAGEAVCDDYERRLLGLERRLARVSRRNVALELKFADAKRSPSGTGHGSPAKKVASQLAKKAAKLEAENDSLKRRLRRLPLAERVARSQSGIAAKRVDDFVHCRDALHRERVGNERLRAECDALRAALDDERSRTWDLRADKDELIAKLGQLRDFVTDLPYAGQQRSSFARLAGEDSEVSPRRHGRKSTVPEPRRNFAAPGPPKPAPPRPASR